MPVPVYSIMIDLVKEVYQVGYLLIVRKATCSLLILFTVYQIRICLEIPLSTGQNLAMGYENWTQAIEGWINEKNDYFYHYPSTSIVSHYTQVNMISENTKRNTLKSKFLQLVFF